MKFKSKIVFIVIVIFAFFITASLIFNIYSLDSRSKKEIAEYEKSELRKTNNNLQNYVHIAYTAVETNYKNSTDKRYLSKFYGSRLVNSIKIIEDIIQQKIRDIKKGKINRSQAQNQVIELCKSLRYDNNAGYFWITDTSEPYPRMIVEPIRGKLNGIVLDDSTFVNIEGTENVFVESVKICNDSTNDGFVYYTWPKPSSNIILDSVKADVPKFAYVHLIKEWGWIIGTGIYLDDAVKEAMEKSISDLRDMRYDNGKGYYWINDDTEPTPRLVMNATWAAGEGKIHTNKRFNRAFGEDINLYEAFLQKAREGDGGFVDYKWDKPLPTGEIIEDAPKQSYVKYFKPLGWVIGSGVYIDDIYTEIDKKKAEMNKSRKSIIINYLIISISVAGISILILILMMNKHFKSRPEENHSNEIARKIDNSASEKKQIKANKEYLITKTDDNEKNNSVIDSAGKLLKIFLSEQTKLLAYNKTIDNLQESDESSDVKELTKEIQSLTTQLKNNFSQIQQFLKDK